MTTAVAALLLLVGGCSSGSDVVRTVEAIDAVELIRSGDPVVVDVRTPAEFEAGHVEGALNIDAQAVSFEEQVGELDKDGEYVLYCQTGNRSSKAAAKMADLGFTEVVDAGGIESLRSAGAQIVPGG